MKLIKNSATGGIWLIAMILYFILFIGISSTANLVGEESISSYETTFNDNIYSTGTCGNVRNYVDPNDGYGNRTYYDYDTFPNPSKFYANLWSIDSESNLVCEYNRGEIAETFCDEVQGCTWTNVTNDCEGIINATYYGIDIVEPLWPFLDRVDDHENTGFFDAASPCNHPDVINNETLCNIFTCEWYIKGTEKYVDATKESEGLKSTYDQVKPIFQFSPFEIFNTDSSVLNFVLSFIFLILPLIILIASLWFTFAPTK